MSNKIEFEITVKGAAVAADDIKKVGAAANEAGKSTAGVAAAGASADKAAVSTQNLQRANMMLSGVLSGNVVTAANSARAALTSMLGPIGLAVAAVTAIGVKLHSVWQEGRAAQAARAADEFAYSLRRARENADDLAKSSVEAFASAIRKARAYYEETGAALERQFNSMQKIARARLSLEQTKIRTDDSLSAEEKILAEQRLINNHEAATLAQKAELLKRQQYLASQAKANADRELEAARAAHAAAKAKPGTAWINTGEIERLEALKRDLDEKIKANNTQNVITASSGPNLNSNARGAAQRETAARLDAERKQVELALEREKDMAAAEERRAREVAALDANLSAAAANAGRTGTALAAANQRLQEFRDTEEEVAGIEEENRNARAEAEVSDSAKRTERLQREFELQSNLAGISARRSAIESNRFLTTEQKQQAILPLIAEENKLLQEKLDMLDAIIAAENDPAKRLEFQRERQSTTRQIDQNNATSAGMQPLSLMDEMRAGAASAADALGTTARAAARAWSEAADSMRSSMGNALGDMLWKTGFTRNAMKNAALDIAEGWVRSGAKMLGDWIYKNTIMQMWSRLTENTATTAKATGVAIRAGLDAEETTSTLINSATREDANISEAGTGLIGAAIKAMNAVASIPYVGPILAIAAMAAIMYAGMALLSGGFRTGGFTGAGGDDELAGVAHKNEWVIPAPLVRAIGIENIPAMLAAAANGADAMSMADGSVTAAMTRPDHTTREAAGAGAAAGAAAAARTKVTVAVVDSPGRAVRLLSSQQGQRGMQRLDNRTAFARGIKR